MSVCNPPPKKKKKIQNKMVQEGSQRLLPPLKGEQLKQEHASRLVPISPKGKPLRSHMVGKFPVHSDIPTMFGWTIGGRVHLHCLSYFVWCLSDSGRRPNLKLQYVKITYLSKFGHIFKFSTFWLLRFHVYIYSYPFDTPKFYRRYVKT